jgi:D-aminopeptidase
VTVWRDEPDPPEGRGIGRSGVTAVTADALSNGPMQAGVAVLNGAGELTASHEIREWGELFTPIYLTSTMAVGRIYDGAVSAAVAANPMVGVDDVVIPMVGECDDSWLSEARVVQVEAEDAGRALAAATTDFEQGAVGAGTGMMCFNFKGGIGSSSRVAFPGGPTVGALVLTNFGAREELRVDGVPVGRLLAGEPKGERRPPSGSCIVVVATDAALTCSDAERVARRAGVGLGRTGSIGHHWSGEIFVAFSTGAGEPAAGRGLDPVFAATIEATEEAVLNSLWHARTVEGREGRVAEALPHDAVLELLERHGRLNG